MWTNLEKMLKNQDDNSKDENENVLSLIEKSLRISRQIFHNSGAKFPDSKDCRSSVLMGGFQKLGDHA